VSFSFVFADSGMNGNNDVPLIPERNDSVVSIIFAGDIMGHSPQFQAAYNSVTKTYNYNDCFEQVKPYIENSDLAVTNLEVPIAGSPYSGYPNFSSPDALLDGLKYAGYDVLITANNHVLDRGKKGLERTIKKLDEKGFKHCGSYLNEQQKDSVYPLIIQVKGFKIAFLNYTYAVNGIDATKLSYVNLLDTVTIKNDILKARNKADFVIITVHWGIEYETNANSEQKKLARIFAREGVDLVVGSHPHVVQNAEFIEVDSVKKVPVFYSLGNSISNQRKINTDGGIMIKVFIDIKSKQILKTAYLPVYVHKGYLNGKYQYHLLPTTDFIANNQKFDLNSTDSMSLMVFDKNTRTRIENFPLINEIESEFHRD